MITLHEDLDNAEKYIAAAKTKEEVDRGVAMTIEAVQKYADELEELIYQIDPDYVLMETP